MTQTPQNPQNPQVPKGYTEEASDIVGFWNPEDGPIHMIPRSAKAHDSTIDPDKISVLIFCELLDPCPVRDPKDKDLVVTGRKGDIVGLWYKPGMKAIENLGGVPVYMFKDGELDTGKPNPMITFKIMKKTRGQLLVLEGDYRSRSKKHPLPLRFADMSPSTSAVPENPF